MEEILRMKPFENTINRLARQMYYIAGLAIVLMMLITTTDVFLRLCVTVHGTLGWQILELLKPIPGTYDLVGLLGTVAASFAMAHTTVRAGHVAVSLLTRLLPDRIQAGLKLITDILSGGLFGTLAWRSFIYAGKLKTSGEVSMTMELPFHPFVYGLAFSAFVVTLVFLIEITKDMNRIVAK